jgi:zinc D-Ala-D-Ala carboxypeptidase
MPTPLTPHFTLEELTKTSTGLPNKPSPLVIKRLTTLAQNILEPLRSRFGAFTPTSTFRGPAVNKRVGGSHNSQHLKGQATDVVIKGVKARDVAKWAKANLNYDQLIFESLKGTEWVHISYVSAKQNRKQAFDIVDNVVKGASF